MNQRPRASGRDIRPPANEQPAEGHAVRQGCPEDPGNAGYHGRYQPGTRNAGQPRQRQREYCGRKRLRAHRGRAIAGGAANRPGGGGFPVCPVLAGSDSRVTGEVLPDASGFGLVRVGQGERMRGVACTGLLSTHHSCTESRDEDKEHQRRCHRHEAGGGSGHLSEWITSSHPCAHRG